MNLKNIYRHDDLGYQVRVMVDRKIINRFFGDRACGGAIEALTAAMQYRDLVYAEQGCTDRAEPPKPKRKRENRYKPRPKKEEPRYKPTLISQFQLWQR